MRQLVEEVRSSRSLPPPKIARAIRVEAHVTQARLARELNVHRLTVARWESGERRPRGILRVRYAELLHDLHLEVAS